MNKVPLISSRGCQLRLLSGRASLQGVYGGNDDVRALADAEARGVEEQVIVPRIRRVFLEMVLDKADAFAVGSLDPPGRLLARDAEPAAGGGDAVVQGGQQADAQRGGGRQDL